MKETPLFFDLLGYCAAFCTTIAFLPQVLQVWRTKSARDVSLSMYVIFCTGVVLWLIYGWLVSSWPVVIGNVVTLILSSTILVMKWRERKSTKP